MARLVATEGVRAGTTVHLQGSTKVGRSLNADLRLDDLTVSREHALFVVTDRGECVVQDLGSGNGTFVNGKSVQTQTLTDGDQIAIGRNKFVFYSDTKSATSVPAESTSLEVEAAGTDSSVLNAIDMDSSEARQEVSDDSTVEQLYNINRRLRTITDIFSSIGAMLDEEEILPKVLDKLFEVFPGTHRGFIILRDPETGKLTPRAAKTFDPNEETRLALSETILEFVLDRKQAILSRDAMHDARFEGSESILGVKMRSVMCAPLKYQNDVLGFILLDTKRVAASYDEDGLALLAGIANQASLAIANARMHEQLLSRQRLEQEMHNASRIQQSFLPRAVPSIEGYEFVDWYATALEVGGDLYDFIELPDNKMVIVVADVSGKGVPAALMMAKIAAHVRFLSASGLAPAGIMKRLNEAVVAGETDMFATALVLHLDCSEHQVKMVNAGHPHPLLKKADGSVEPMKGDTAFPIGILEEVEFPEVSLVLQPNDRLCVFTDGITEAMNENKECFGEDRLEKVLRESSNSASEIVENLQRALREHVGSATQSDDLTWICFGPTERS